MTLKKLPTSAACDVVGLDRQRLNEDIASGIYQCAPEARASIGRFWDKADLCGLFVYAFLLRVYGAGGQDALKPGDRKPALSKKVAAMYACQIAAAMRSGLDDGETRIDFPLSGFNDDWSANHADQPPSFFAGQVGSEIATICFSLNGIQAGLDARMKVWSGESA
ncbi:MULTISPECIES: hypothetical protein [Roseobacteraceae]|uniref:Uncharacterized protein n=1 Tax=Pseudosulfitobacter pseudonitzschiae TaxID=1402135 RepID=A0A221K1P9_9RHOB|nr:MULTISPECIES: hypothetical protein [Roseobacteraceae]ASM72833.1 hypothetical protein SULPSESMR1_02030 [Pseudosulfitobacter pseudonitzschiae]